MQKTLRALRRQAEGRRRRTLEDELATRQGRRAEAQKLVRLLARRSRGTAKRRLNALCVHKPTAQEIRETAELDAAHGGLSAMIVNREEQQRSWVEEETEFRYRIERIEKQCQNVDAERKGSSWTRWRSGNIEP